MCSTSKGRNGPADTGRTKVGAAHTRGSDSAGTSSHHHLGEMFEWMLVLDYISQVILVDRLG